MDWLSTTLILGQAAASVPPPIRFVTPIFSVMAAAMNSNVPQLAANLRFAATCDAYARNNGLLDALEGNYSFPIRNGLQGVTYSKLTKLSSATEVEACNSIVGDLIHEKIGKVNQDAAFRISSVVGELHDNVASHAKGMGYSAAQTYSVGGQERLVFAIADRGCGMLANVQRVHQSIDNHLDAIRWCMSPGNTTAQNPSSWAQWLPEDSICNPYPTSVNTKSCENHHMGLGLAKLAQLVTEYEGELWVLSGDFHIFSKFGNETSERSRLEWTGVAIEFEIPIPLAHTMATPVRPELEELGKRIGI